jgi:predicted Rossmann fold flavoprotein
MAKKEIAIIGGGAAGFFTAANLSGLSNAANITIYEGSNKLLSKVLISGGGRCNVTNTISDPSLLAENYPRGKDFLLDSFKQFSTADTQDWFNQRGVPLKTEPDGRVFPLSNSSQTIYNCLEREAKINGVQIKTHHRLEDISKEDNGYLLSFNKSEIKADFIVLATGSNAPIYKILKKLDVDCVPQVPSLFTFEAKRHLQLDLAGVSIENARVSINEIKDSEQQGPLLITHWGYTGPSILRLSAWQARNLNELEYKFTLSINWLSDYSSAGLHEELSLLTTSSPKDKVASWKKHGLPKRLWNFILQKAEIKEYTNWSEIGKKGINRLVDALTKYEVFINKKSTFKDEFVTAGGINLDELDNTSFAIKKHNNLYAAGEILNIDAITGGFNFQAAWTGSLLIAKHISTILE